MRFKAAHLTLTLCLAMASANIATAQEAEDNTSHSQDEYSKKAAETAKNLQIEAEKNNQSGQVQTLRDALLLAYKGNPTLTGARAGQQAIDENVVIAKSSGRPTAGSQAAYTENFLRSANSFTAPLRQVTAGISLTVPIYQGGAVRNAIKAARTRVEAGQANLRGTEASIFSAVVAAYLDVIQNEIIMDLQQTNANVLKVNLQATRDRFEIGDLTRTDVAQSEARLSIALSDFETARANLIRSRENYIALVGVEPGLLQLPPPLPNLPETAEQAVDIALDNNPDLESTKENIKAAEYDIQTAKGAVMPRVEIYAQGGYANFLGTLGGNSNLASSNFIQEQSTAETGVRATFPLYQGGAPGARIRQAQARTGQAKEAHIATERDVIAQTRAAFSSYIAAQEVIVSSQKAIEANSLALEGVRAENSVGNRTVLDILDAERELLNARVLLVQAQRSAYVAGFTLLAAMGMAEARDLGFEEETLYDPDNHYDEVDGKIWDWADQNSPQSIAPRTVDTQAQNAAIYGPEQE